MFRSKKTQKIVNNAIFIHTVLLCDKQINKIIAYIILYNIIKEGFIGENKMYCTFKTHFEQYLTLKGPSVKYNMNSFKVK